MLNSSGRNDHDNRGRRLNAPLAAMALVAVVAAGCDSQTEPARDIGDVPYELLTDYRFFDGPLSDMKPAAGVLEYAVAAPLFADNAEKGRYIALPDGETMTLADEDEWDLPVGTFIIKSFFFDNDRRDGPKPEDTFVVETRLLEVADGELRSHIYRWNEDQTEGEYIRAGADVTMDYTDVDGQAQTQDYIIPDENACGSCHERDDVLRVLGLSTHQLNRTTLDGTQNQIDWLVEQGALAAVDTGTLPAFADPSGQMDLDARARAYLHGNCSHCHRPGGGGGSSGLKFLAWEDDPAQFGICKVPAAAGPGTGGNAYDIVPGHPERSIVTHRMASTDPEIKMPELPSLLADDFGVDLISEWIAAMPEQECTGNMGGD